MGKALKRLQKVSFYVLVYINASGKPSVSLNVVSVNLSTAVF